MSLTEEETNYLRLAILVIKLSPKALRVLFDIKFPPADLGSILTRKFSRLQNLQNQRIINQAQWDLLFPTGTSSCSDNYDLTLMICLLRNISAPPIIKPPTGFDRLPPDNDKSEGADLARMKFYRNLIAHSNVAELQSSDFDYAWKNLTKAIERIGGGRYNQDCIDLRVALLDGSDKEIYLEVISTKQELEILKHETVKWNVLQLYQKKIQEWEEKDQKYVHTAVTDSVLTAAGSNQCLLITGNSGSGKSSLVHHVALELQKQGYMILVIKKPVELIWYQNPEVPQVVVCDDICGKYYADKALIEEWIRYEEDIKLVLENNDIRLLLNSRLIVSQDEHFKMMSFLSPFMVNLNSAQHRFSLSERKDMLSVHLGKNINVSDESLNSQDCFPLLCELFGENESLRNDPEKFFAHPFEEYRKDLEKLKLKEPMKFCALALLVLFEDSIEETVLTEFNIKAEIQEKIDNVCHAVGTAKGAPRTKLKDELESLENVYCRKTDGKFKSLHDKMYDFLSATIGPSLGECLLRYSSCGFIKERIRLSSALQNDDENVIILPQSSEHSFFQRMFSDIMDGKIKDVFFNKQMSQGAFEDALIRELVKLSEDDFRNLIEKKGKYPDLSKRNKTLIDPISTLGKMADDLDEVAKFHLNYTYSLLYQKNTCTFHWILARGLHRVFLYVEERLPQYVKRRISEDYNLCISLAILEAKTDILESIFKNYPLATKHDDDKRYYPLFLFVCFTGNLELAKFLYEKKHYSPETETGESAVWLASFSCQMDVLKFLVSHKFDVNLPNHVKATPLLIACQRGHLKVVEYLLQNHADVNLCKINGTSPLFVSCQEGHFEIAKCLLDHKANVNKCKIIKTTDSKQDNIKILNSTALKKEEERGISPLFVACKNGHLRIIKLLLDHHANTELCTSKGKTPLIVALQNQFIEIASLLIEKGAAINYRMDNNLGPLTVVSGIGHTSLLTKLLDKGARVNINVGKNCSDGHKHNIPSPLTMAAMNNHLEVAKILISKGADINYCGVEGATALFEAADKGHFSMVEYLLSVKASVDIATHMSRTPLFVAVQRKFVNIVELLLKNNARVNICRDDGMSPLLMATLRSHEKIVCLLLNYKADPDLATVDGHSPLLAAAKFDDPKILNLLINANAKIDCIDKYGRSPLWTAALNGNVESVKILLWHNADPNISDVNQDSVLYCAVTSGKVSAVELLIEAGSDVNRSNHDGASPLIIAVQYNYLNIVEFLLSKGALVNSKTIDGKSTLVTAVENSNAEIVRTLCENGAILNNRENPQENVLWKAISQGDTKIVEVLLENGVNIYEYVNGESPLDFAQRLKHDDIYKILQQKQGKFIGLCKTVGKLTLYYSYIEKLI